MAVKVEPVVLDGSLGRRWWERPNFIWCRRDSVRERCLRVTLARTILPLLQGLETLQRKHYPDAALLLKGKTFEQVENDPAALEFALHLYELALSKDLILTRSDNKGGLASVRKRLGVAAGSCTLSPDQVSQRYVCQLAASTLERSGHSADDLNIYIPANAQSRVASLARLRTLVLLDKTTVVEMRQGLGGLDDLLKKDRAWLDALAAVDVANFLRPLRKALAEEFAVVLSWSVVLLKAAAEGLSHPSKLQALGTSVQVVKDPAIFKALGAWPMAKGPQGESLSRIAMIKKQLGAWGFSQLLQGSPGLVAELGTWPAPKIEFYKEHLPILTGPVLQIFEPLEDDHRLAMLNALTARFGPKNLTAAFKTKEGLGALQGVVGEIVSMNQASKQDTKKIRNLIAGSYFDAYLVNFQAQEASTKNAAP